MHRLKTVPGRTVEDAVDESLLAGDFEAFMAMFENSYEPMGVLMRSKGLL